MIRMLVATDGSLHALRAAAMAARLARELRAAEVAVVNVGHIPAMAMGGPEALVNFGALEEGLWRAGQAILESTVRELADVGVPVARSYRSGEPSSEIIKAAQEMKADLIIVGSRGLGQIGELILGSVSERVLHGSHTPVLIVR